MDTQAVAKSHLICKQNKELPTQAGWAKWSQPCAVTWYILERRIYSFDILSYLEPPPTSPSPEKQVNIIIIIIKAANHKPSQSKNMKWHEWHKHVESEKSLMKWKPISSVRWSRRHWRSPLSGATSWSDKALGVMPRSDNLRMFPSKVASSKERHLRPWVSMCPRD